MRTYAVIENAGGTLLVERRVDHASVSHARLRVIYRPGRRGGSPEGPVIWINSSALPELIKAPQELAASFGEGDKA